MKEYFKIIRAALAENRKKGGVYYEAHHIVPKSFGKKSSTVLLTPQEHYRVHKILAEYWKGHSTYSQKMLWAFHRLAYDGKRQLTEEEFAEARQLLVGMWTKKKSEQFKQNLSKKMKGNTNNSSRVFKGMQSTISKEGREKLAEVRRKLQTGKKGSEAQAAKGPYTVIYETGERITAGSYPELSKATGIPFPTLQNRIVKCPGVMKRGFAVIQG